MKSMSTNGGRKRKEGPPIFTVGQKEVLRLLYEKKSQYMFVRFKCEEGEEKTEKKLKHTAVDVGTTRVKRHAKPPL